jgi:hypothetical protein
MYINVVVRFVDNGGIVDHRSFNLSFYNMCDIRFDEHEI